MTHVKGGKGVSILLQKGAKTYLGGGIMKAISYYVISSNGVI